MVASLCCFFLPPRFLFEEKFNFLTNFPIFLASRLLFLLISNKEMMNLFFDDIENWELKIDFASEKLHFIFFLSISSDKRMIKWAREKLPNDNVYDTWIDIRWLFFTSTRRRMMRNSHCTETINYWLNIDNYV